MQVEVAKVVMFLYSLTNANWMVLKQLLVVFLVHFP